MPKQTEYSKKKVKATYNQFRKEIHQIDVEHASYIDYAKVCEDFIEVMDSLVK